MNLPRYSFFFLFPQPATSLLFSNTSNSLSAVQAEALLSIARILRSFAAKSRGGKDSKLARESRMGTLLKLRLAFGRTSGPQGPDVSPGPPGVVLSKLWAVGGLNPAAV